MPKFFVASDIHSYFTIFKEELDKQGFNPNDENHWLVICGDYFDRGKEPLELINYLNSIERKILIKGNHEYLINDLLARHYAKGHDYPNGTYDTVKLLASFNSEENGYCPTEGRTQLKDVDYYRVEDIVKDFQSKMVNYFETEHYIFVHAWIPYKYSNNIYSYKMSDYSVPVKEYDKNWREAEDYEWEEASWDNPFNMYDYGLNQTGKTIVFGHWHCSTGWARYNWNDFEDKMYVEFKNKNADEDGMEEIECFDIFRKDSEQYGSIISIDACTAYSGKCNVLVIEDEFIK